MPLSRTPRPGRTTFLVTLTAWLVCGSAWAQPAVIDSPAPAFTLSIGVSFDAPETVATLSGTLAGDPLDGVRVRVPVAWSAIEGIGGSYDWSALDTAVDTLREAGARPALALDTRHERYGSVQRLPEPGPALEAWLAFVRAAARRYVDRVDVFEIGAVGTPAADAVDAYAFLLKSSALAARAEARALGRQVRVAQAQVTSLDLQRNLWAKDVAAYIDIMPVGVDAGPGLNERVAEVLAANLLHPPAAEVWLCVRAEGAAADDAWSAAAAAVGGLAAGAPVALIDLAASDPSTNDELLRWVGGTDRLFRQGFAPAPLPRVRFESPAGAVLAGGEVVGAFLSERDFTSLLFYRAPGEDDGVPRDRLVLDTAFVQNARVVDPANGRELRVGSSAAGADGRGRAIRVLSGVSPRAVLYQRPASQDGIELPPEEVATSREREPSAEEIIAAYQAVQRVQDDRLERWMAQGRIDFHFKLAQGGSTVDVAIDSNYFWERGGPLEWEQTTYYVNGNRVKWKSIPELPLIQPEKVITLPLDLTFDKSYSYRKVGRERVEGRDAWVLEFQPADTDASGMLYRGRVWIDVETAQRMKVSVIQSGLEAPVLSNEEVDLFRDHLAADGASYRLLTEIDGQQIWSAAGRNFVVRREVSFTAFEINPSRDEFERRRAVAYASSNQMLRDTDEGFRYLEQLADGGRQVKEGVDSSQWFAAAGAFADSSTDGVTPLAGVNYFNYDVGRKNVQVNALFGGVVGFFTASKPDLIGKRISGTVDAFGSVLYFGDSVFEGNDEIEELQLDTRGQLVSLRLGVPVGQFVKFNLVGALLFQQYDESEDGEDALDAYNAANPGQSLRVVLPSNHQELTSGVEIEFNRRGFSLAGSASWSKRSEWQTWGLFDDTAATFVEFDTTSGTFVPGAPEPVEDRFMHWKVSGFKEWYLPKFQKLRGELNYLDGSKQDRFSRYQFSLFGDDRLNGYAGTGVRFDQAWIARAGYSFNLFEVIRFDAVLENAWVENDAASSERLSFTGFGLAANVVGPWKTVWSASYGRALRADIEDLEGEQEFLLLVLKLF